MSGHRQFPARHALRAALAWLLVATFGSAPTAQPARETVHGVVVDALTREPVRRVLVHAVAPGGSDLVATTDADGRFVLPDLARGKYSLSASKTGFWLSRYGQARFDGPSLALEVPGESGRPPVEIALWRGGVITGQVLDEHGEPALRANVRALQSRYRDGARQLVPVLYDGSATTTDDRGTFRLYNLPPGRYVLAAHARLLAPAPPPAAAESRGPTLTFFPDAIDAANAEPISIAAGQEVAVTIALGTARASRVRGRALRSAGGPYEGYVNLARRESHGIEDGGSAVVRSDGSFEFPRVMPGTYQLTLGARPGFPAATDEVGVALVTVAGDDLDDVLVVAGRAGVARGRLVTAEGTPPPVAPSEIRLATRAAGAGRAFRYTDAVRVRDDFSFEIAGLIGDHVIEASARGGDASWTTRAVLRQGDDITDMALQFGPNSVVEGVTIVLARASAEVIGTVMDASGRLAADTRVVLFPATAALWRSARFIRCVQTDGRGEFRLSALLPLDRYLITAVPADSLDESDCVDPNRLRSLAPSGVELSLGDGSRRSLMLSLAAP